jgi:hypothetical protein
MVYKGKAGRSYEYEIWEKDLFNEEIRKVNQSRDLRGDRVATWVITQEDFDKGLGLEGEALEFIFEVENKLSEVLTVRKDSANDSDRNKPPTATIVNPEMNSRFLIGREIAFEQLVHDEDDDLEVTWDFGDGNTITLRNCLSGTDCNVNYTYQNSGTKVISLTAREMSRPQRDHAYVRIFIYGNGTNVFAVVDKPALDEVINGTRVVEFSGKTSYVAKCSSTCGSSSCYDVEGLQCYDLAKSGIPGSYELWFNWTFSEGEGRHGSWSEDYGEVVEFERAFFAPVRHWAKLKVGYEEK